MDQSTQNNYDQVTIDTPALFLPISEDVLLATLNEAENRANIKYNTMQLAAKGKENIEFWLGNQVDQNKMDTRYQQAHVDNISHQDLEGQIKMASGKMPDIFVAPPDNEQYNIEAAHDIQEWLRERITSNTMKRLIKNGLRHMNLKYIAIIKPRWDYQRKDFCFELIDPDDMRFSEGSKVPEDGFTIDGTDITFQYVEEPTQVVLAKFKKKDTQLRQEIGVQTKDRTKLPARLKYTEVHFRWFDSQGRMNEGTCWRYGNLILDSMKEPYFDYDNPKINYFDAPRKPYILMSYLNLGKSVYESTTVFEQSKSLNRIINKRRRQITEISDRAIPKAVFTGKAMTKEMAANISPSPNEGILLNEDIDDVRKGMGYIPAVAPSPMLFSDLQDMRNRVDSMFATKSTGGDAQNSSASGISKQIGREGDLVTSDDIVDIVVERVVEEMAQWAMQFARLFYDDDREPLRVTNNEGETTHVKLDRKKIETDIQAVVKASTNDKTTRRADALQQLSGKITDPYTFFEDIEVPNPKERTKRLITFIKSQTAGDWTEYLKTIDVQLDESRAETEDAERDIELLQNGGTPSVDKRPSEAYIATLMAFVQSQEYETLDEGAKQRMQAHIAALKAQVAKIAAQQGGGQEQQPTTPDQAMNGAPGVAPQPPAYGPEVDTATQFGGGQPQAPTMQSLQQRVQFPVTQATQPGLRK